MGLNRACGHDHDARSEYESAYTADDVIDKIMLRSKLTESLYLLKFERFLLAQFVVPDQDLLKLVQCGSDGLSKAPLISNAPFTSTRTTMPGLPSDEEIA